MGYSLPDKEGNPFWPMAPDYGSVHEGAKRERRLELLHGWYDPNKPGELISDKEVFLAALYLYVEHYVKKCQQLKHLYFLPDSSHKAIMQRMFTNPRSALVAPRGGTKTFTIVLELAPFLACFRPNTSILIGSETATLTVDKIKSIRKRVEENGRIAKDFGQVWSKTNRSSSDWSNKCLDFSNGSSITGSSIDMATRGRHPMVGLIDDPEGKRSSNPQWRAKFMDWLFHDYLNQFRDKGTHVMWIGTILRTDSCLWRAIHNDDEESRFIGWERRILKMVYEDPPDSGTMVSAWPEQLTVEQFERKKDGRSGDGSVDVNVTPIGFAAVMAEFQGEPIPAGEKMFHRDERRHGYMMCEDDHGRKFIYDPATGRTQDFRELRKQCFVYGAVDIADTPAAHADFSAIVFAMLDPDGVFWIVDAWQKRCFSDRTAVQAMQMSSNWQATKLAWEHVGLSKRIFREAHKLRNQRLKDGHCVPALVGIDSQGVPKEQRIERLRPDFDAGNFKFPIMREMDGYRPMKLQNGAHFHKLLEQIDTMTGEGTAGYDDLLDALEMLHRIAVKAPKRIVAMPEGRQLIEHWNRHGINVDPMQTPREGWTPEMRKTFDERTMPTPYSVKECHDAFV